MAITVCLLESVPFVMVYATRFVDVDDDKCRCWVAVRFKKFNKFFFYNNLVAVFVNISKVAVIFFASNSKSCN